jgi:hypothetical protein
VRLPLVFAVVLAVLLGYRILEYLRSRKPKAAPVAAK